MNDVPEDAAWVTLDSPLAPDRMAAFCGDLERLYRINPYFEFRHWHNEPDGADVSYRNLSNGRDAVLRLTRLPDSVRAFTVRYDRGIKQSTRFEIESACTGSRLKITDSYRSAATPDAGAVDRSLHAWGVALHEYLQREARWGDVRLWRWYMRRVWVPMKPSARRITFVILLITLAEFAFFLLVMAIYWIEFRG